MLTYWDGLIKKKLVSTIPGFSAEFYNAIGSGQIATSIEAAWGPGVLAASLNDKTSGEWQVAPLPQWAKDQPFHSGNWGGSCNVVPKAIEALEGRDPLFRLVEHRQRARHEQLEQLWDLSRVAGRACFARS